MSVKDAIGSWNARQHLYVFGVGLFIYAFFAVAAGFVALAYYSPGAFLAVLALGVVSYLTGVAFSVLLLNRGNDEEGD